MASSILFTNEFGQVSTFNLAESDKLSQMITKENELVFQGVTITHPLCSAQVSLYGGQVLSYKPEGFDDVFWLSQRSMFDGGKAIRGGVPICWPWFGINDKAAIDKKVIKHGFARLSNWQVSSIDADEKAVVIELVLSGENSHQLWTNGYQLRQRLSFGSSFKQSLYMSNLSKEDIEYSGAFHNYFNVSNPDNIQIGNLTDVKYFDQLTQKNALQAEPVNCVGEIDRVYQTNKSMSLIDSQWNRQIKVTSTHCQEWVLWNPGTKLANAMDDIHQDGENEYVCLEAANVKWHKLLAGKTVVMSQEVSVSG